VIAVDNIVEDLWGSDGVKDTDGKDIQHKPKSLCHGDLSLWRDVMPESSCWHTRQVFEDSITAVGHTYMYDVSKTAEIGPNEITY